MTTASTPDYLSGVTEKTTRGELIELLKKATAEQRASTEARADRLVELERSIRAKWAGMSAEPLLQIIVQGTESELTEALEFMGDLEEVLPATLQRLLIGCRMLLETPNGKSGT